MRNHHPNCSKHNFFSYFTLQNSPRIFPAKSRGNFPSQLLLKLTTQFWIERETKRKLTASITNTIVRVLLFILTVKSFPHSRIQFLFWRNYGKAWKKHEKGKVVLPNNESSVVSEVKTVLIAKTEKAWVGEVTRIGRTRWNAVLFKFFSFCANSVFPTLFWWRFCYSNQIALDVCWKSKQGPAVVIVRSVILLNY